jgi:hypothetical protein
MPRRRHLEDEVTVQQHPVFDPYDTPTCRIVTISADLLAALAASATHEARRVEPPPGDDMRVRWECPASCPLCLTRNLLGDDDLL